MPGYEVRICMRTGYIDEVKSLLKENDLNPRKSRFYARDQISLYGYCEMSDEISEKIESLGADVSRW